MKKTLFSGAKPTGIATIGNYLGAFKNWVRLQQNYNAIYAIVDFHALTIAVDPDELRVHSRALAIDMLASGIDPKKSILFKQSDVPEHTELAWIFSCLTPVPELERMTQYKDLTQTHKKVSNAGMLTYPVLQAADILIYKATYVPVGEDQLQHLELARIIARKFNAHYKDTFPEIKPLVEQSAAARIMSLTDPAKKMSKSLGEKSYISLRDNADAIRKKINRAVTDSQNDTNTLTGGHNLLMLYQLVGPSTRFKKYETAYKLRDLSYADLKADLTEQLIKLLGPIQAKHAYYEKHSKEVDRILTDGAKRARKIAQATMNEVRKLTGLSS